MNIIAPKILPTYLIHFICGDPVRSSVPERDFKAQLLALHSFIPNLF